MDWKVRGDLLDLLYICIYIIYFLHLYWLGCQELFVRYAIYIFSSFYCVKAFYKKKFFTTDCKSGFHWIDLLLCIFSTFIGFSVLFCKKKSFMHFTIDCLSQVSILPVLQNVYIYSAFLFGFSEAFPRKSSFITDCKSGFHWIDLLLCIF